MARLIVFIISAVVLAAAMCGLWLTDSTVLMKVFAIVALLSAVPAGWVVGDVVSRWAVFELHQN